MALDMCTDSLAFVIGIRGLNFQFDGLIISFYDYGTCFVGTNFCPVHGNVEICGFGYSAAIYDLIAIFVRDLASELFCLA